MSGYEIRNISHTIFITMNEEESRMTRIESSIDRVRWKCQLLRLIRSYDDNEGKGAVWWNEYFGKSTKVSADGTIVTSSDAKEGATLLEDSDPFYSIEGRGVSDDDVMKAFETCSVEKQAQILDICKRRISILRNQDAKTSSSALPLSLTKHVLSLHKMASIYDKPTNRTLLFPSLAMISSLQNSNASYESTSKKSAIIIKSTRALRRGENIFINIKK